MSSRVLGLVALGVAACAVWLQGAPAYGQMSLFSSRSDVSRPDRRYTSPAPAPQRMVPAELARPSSRTSADSSWRREPAYVAERPRTSGSIASSRYQPQPRYARQSSRPDSELLTSSAPEPIPAGSQGDPFSEVLPYEESGDMTLSPEPFLEEGAGNCSSCQSCNSCNTCASCDTCGPCILPCLWQCIRHSYLFSNSMWENLSTASGGQGFKGPVDRGVNGNFGFYKNVNWGSPLWNAKGIGFQLGGSIALSDFDGGAGLVDHHRTQFFVTTGVFHRPTCNQGLQGGAAFDYLHDEFYVNMNLTQVRAEISYLWNCHEIGFWSAAHTGSDTKLAPPAFGSSTDPQTKVTWQANDQYNLFYRHNFCNGGVARMWAGLSSHADGIFGFDGTAPLSQRWAVQASYNYLLPRNDDNVPGSIKETWNLSVGLVWFPGYKRPGASLNQYRPLFNVADNGTFMITEKN